MGFVQEELLTLCENNSVCLSMYTVGKLKIMKDLLFELETTLSLLAFENLSGLPVSLRPSCVLLTCSQHKERILEQMMAGVWSESATLQS